MEIDCDIMIVGAGPVGLLSAYLAHLCDLKVCIVDKSSAPLQVGRADALNGRTLQLLEIVNLFNDLYPLGKVCNTSSVYADGKFLSRQSAWWEALEGCFHKHFLMLGQAYTEQLLDEKLQKANGDGGKGQCILKRNTTVQDIQLTENECRTTLSNGETVSSRFLIGADGSHSFVRNHFKVPFNITRPEIVWAVVDGVIETTFEKVPEIIVFQTETSDVSWIPREADIDRFYIRMDRKDFTFEETMERINIALYPHTLTFKEVRWFSQFSVKESVAEQYVIDGKVFLAGDAAHIHSVNGGQGLNTGLADAMNLVFKLHAVIRQGAPLDHLQAYERERKPVAESVIQSSGALVRSTKFSEHGTHAQDYVKIVEKKAGNITGMGINYHDEKSSDVLQGIRLHDFLIEKNISEGGEKEIEHSGSLRVYTLLDYRGYTLVAFNADHIPFSVPSFVKPLYISIPETSGDGIKDNDVGSTSSSIQEEKENISRSTVHDGLGLYHLKSPCPYSSGQLLLVRPDSYIAASGSLEGHSFIDSFLQYIQNE